MSIRQCICKHTNYEISHLPKKVGCSRFQLMIRHNYGLPPTGQPNLFLGIHQLRFMTGTYPFITWSSCHSRLAKPIHVSGTMWCDPDLSSQHSTSNKMSYNETACLCPASHFAANGEGQASGICLLPSSARLPQDLDKESLASKLKHLVSVKLCK